MTDLVFHHEHNGGTAELVPAEHGGGLTIDLGPRQRRLSLADRMPDPLQPIGTSVPDISQASFNIWNVNVQCLVPGFAQHVFSAVSASNLLSVDFLDRSMVRGYYFLQDDHPIASGIGWPRVFDELRRAAARAGASQSVVDAAVQAARFLAMFVFIVPEVSDGSDGDLSLLWIHDDLEASLSFDLDGSVAGYAYRRGAPGPWAFEGARLDWDALHSFADILSGT